MYLSVYDLLTGPEKDKAQQAAALVTELENTQVLLETQADSTPVTEEDKAQLTKLVASIRALRF